MPRVFIDTNVLVSAVVFDRKELELIIRCTTEGHELFISEHILEEARRVFQMKFPGHREMLERFVEISGIVVIRKEVYMNTIRSFDDIRDKYDAHVIACAESSLCEFIVTGDKDLLNYKHPKIKIMKSAEFFKGFTKR